MGGLLSLLFDVGAVRRPQGWLGHVLGAYAALITATIIYVHVFTFVQPWTLAAVFMAAVFVLVFPLVQASKRADPLRPSIFDWMCCVLSMAVLVHFILSAERIVNRIPVLDELTWTDQALGVVFIVLAIEVTRRTTGILLTIVVLAFLAHYFLGHHLPGVLAHNKIGADAFLENVVYGTYGINGVVARVAASYAVLFVLFGVLLALSGGGEFFFNLAATATGRSAGGPAKVAVVSSGLYGMISGNAVSDVMTTGSVTIPIMKRLGYSPRYAAAVEASASSGGSIMPPVMGAAAFVMVEYTGIPYADIAFAALGPALLYYMAVFCQVHFRAKRENMAPLPADQIPSVGATLRDGGIFLVPLGVLVGALTYGYTATMAAVLSSAGVIVVAALRARTRIGPLKLYQALGETMFRMVVITGACAAAGLVIAGLTLTGLAQKLSFLVGAVTGQNLFLTLIVAAVVTTILGMGMPTVSAYILAAVLIGPLLSELGVPVLAGHMFLLYYACMSAITPPVAVAAYAAASIAEANPMAVAVTAVRMAFVAFVVPFGFVYAPEILLQGEALLVVLNWGSAACGCILAGAAIEGYLLRPLNRAGRVVAGLAGVALLVPLDPVETLVLLLATGVGVAWHAMQRPATQAVHRG